MIKDQFKNEEVCAEELLLIAHHEAGHAVMGYLFGECFEFITIVPNEQLMGFVRFKPEINAYYNYLVFKLLHPERVKPYGYRNEDGAVLISNDMRAYVELRMLICAAGVVAEIQMEGLEKDLDEIDDRWLGDGDQRNFEEHALSITGSESEFYSYYNYMLERTWSLMLIPEHQKAVKLLAEQLIVEKTVSYERACTIIASCFSENKGTFYPGNNLEILEMGGAA